MSRPAVAPLPVVAERICLDFDPARDGFAFANVFRWTEPDLATLASRLRPASWGSVAAVAGAGALVAGPAAALAGAGAGLALAAGGLGDGAVRGLAQRWPTFGLCGGMALAAVERWPRRDGSLPTCALEREPMRALFRRRQDETLRRSLPRFLSLWARARLDGSPHPPLAAPMQREVARAVELLRSGRPVVLGLVGDAPDPFANHQVVAFGVEVGERPGEARFSVYDPNAPGQTRHVRTGVLGTDPTRTDITTDLPTGRRANGSAHICTHQGRLGSVLVVA